MISMILSLDPPEIFYDDELLSLYFVIKTDLNRFYKIFDSFSLEKKKEWKYLDLRNQNLTKVPDMIQNMPGLINLDLSENQIEVIPVWLKTLNNLSSLNISSNVIKEIPDWMKTMKNLTSLDISCNEIKVIPDFIGNLKNLTSFEFNYNPILWIPDSFLKLDEKVLQCDSHKLWDFRIDALTYNITGDSLETLEKLRVRSYKENWLTIVPDKIFEKGYRFIYMEAEKWDILVRSEYNVISELEMKFGKEIKNISSFPDFESMDDSAIQITVVEGHVYWLRIPNIHLDTIEDQINKFTELQIIETNAYFNELPEWLKNHKKIKVYSLDENKIFPLPNEIRRNRYLIDTDIHRYLVFLPITSLFPKICPEELEISFNIKELNKIDLGSFIIKSGEIMISDPTLRVQDDNNYIPNQIKSIKSLIGKWKSFAIFKNRKVKSLIAIHEDFEEKNLCYFSWKCYRGGIDAQRSSLGIYDMEYYRNKVKNPPNIWEKNYNTNEKIFWCILDNAGIILNSDFDLGSYPLFIYKTNSDKLAGIWIDFSGGAEFLYKLEPKFEIKPFKWDFFKRNNIKKLKRDIDQLARRDLSYFQEYYPNVINQKFDSETINRDSVFKYQGRELPKKEVIALEHLESICKEPIPFRDPKSLENELKGFFCNENYVTEIKIYASHPMKIPESLNNFEQLQKLEIHAGYLIFPKSLKHLKNLKTFTLKCDNYFSSSFIGDLIGLRKLEIRGRNLGHISKTIGNLIELKELKLDCPLLEIPEEIGNLIDLEILDLSGLRYMTQSFTHIPYSVGKLKKLRILNLEGQENLKFLPISIVNLKSLKSLNIRLTKIEKLTYEMLYLKNNGCKIERIIYHLDELDSEDEAILETEYGKSAWIPIVNESEIALSDSKIYGEPLLIEGEKPPKCTVCQSTMQLLLQLNIPNLPIEFKNEMDMDKGIFQFFSCRNEYSAGDPFVKRWLFRIIFP